MRKKFEITRTIYSNSERSEEFLVTECFFLTSWRFLIMAIRVVEFSNGTKLERFLPKNQHTQRKVLNFEN